MGAVVAMPNQGAHEIWLQCFACVQSGHILKELDSPLRIQAFLTLPLLQPIQQPLCLIGAAVVTDKRCPTYSG